MTRSEETEDQQTWRALSEAGLVEIRLDEFAEESRDVKRIVERAFMNCWISTPPLRTGIRGVLAGYAERIGVEGAGEYSEAARSVGDVILFRRLRLIPPRYF